MNLEWILIITGLWLFVIGTSGIALSKGNVLKILMCLVLIALSLFIAYGLDTWCADYGVYIYCGGE